MACVAVVVIPGGIRQLEVSLGPGAMEAEAEVSYRIHEVAERANVPEGFVRRLIAVGGVAW